MKIKDRFVLGLISGLTGNAVKMAVDEMSLRQIELDPVWWTPLYLK